MTATDPITGNPIEQAGLSLAVFRRQADGKWLMVIDNPHGSVLLAK
jgi:ketosteroid isomerase-like protein